MSVSIIEPYVEADRHRTSAAGYVPLLNNQARLRFREFVKSFRQGNVYFYRDALTRQFGKNEYCLEIDLAHVNEYDEMLFNSLQVEPTRYLPFLESGTKDAIKELVTSKTAEATDANTDINFQIILKSGQVTQSIRSLTAEHVNKLIKVPGIIIGCSRVRAKATRISVQCTECKQSQKLECPSAMGGVAIPPKCSSSDGATACTGTYVIMADSCEYIDQQTLKLQESPEVVPTGEMPRNIMLSVDRYLVDRVTPGTRVSVMGVFSLMTAGGDKNRGSSSSSIKVSFLRVVGIQIESDGGGRSTSYFTSQEEEELQQLARDPNIYRRLSKSIAPQISGDYTNDIKKALACLLMSGSRKILPDGVKLRGDINILLMGDPSTAKSQFLKFIERVAPIGVYTSGKGSSAAGLTASVIRDSRGEFYLEGGAMVLADGGVICIDEFDKMRETDRVAIHEAMEQQTISIAKAGITTVLNSRAAVLAAANPIYGRYDDMKSVGDNIDLMTTILSRFDCIFIVRDIRDQEKDRATARHVLGIHTQAAGNTEFIANGDPDVIPVATLKKFVSYCRDRCAPRLSDEAAALLSSQYVHIRDELRHRLQDDQSDEKQVVPITIRQLEALVRMSESLAKMRLSAEATVSDVNEALRLFKVSTLAASQSNAAAGNGAASQEVLRAEEFLKRRMGLRMTINTKSLMEESLVQGHSAESVQRAISVMIMRSELQELNQRKILKRIR